MADRERLPNSIVALVSSGLLLGGIPGWDVDEKQRAGLVVSVALWSLRERHTVDFSSWEHRRWWWPFEPAYALMIAIASGKTSVPEIRPRAPFRVQRFSLEQELLNQARKIASSPHDGTDSTVSARDVIYEWLGDDYGNPHREVIERVTEQGKTAGCLEVALRRRGNPLARFLLGPRVVIIPSTARAAVLTRAAQKLADEWHRFLRDESALANWLIATVMDAIEARTYYRDIDC